MPLAPSRSVPLLLAPLLFAVSACQTPAAPNGSPQPTNATLNFVLPPGRDVLTGPVTVSLVVTRPNAASLHNAPTAGDAIDGRATFPAGTRAAAVVAHYTTLLQQHGWVAGTHFLAAGNSLHFYGITALAAGTDGEQLGVAGATDSDGVPFHMVTPLTK